MIRFQVHISKSENDVDKVAEVFAKKERAAQNEEQRPSKNILLAVRAHLPSILMNLLMEMLLFQRLPNLLFFNMKPSG